MYESIKLESGRHGLKSIVVGLFVPSVVRS